MTHSSSTRQWRSVSHKKERKDGRIAKLNFNSSQRVLPLISSSKVVVSLPTENRNLTYTSVLRKTFTRSQKARKNWSRTLLWNGKRSISRSKTLRNIKLSTLISSKKSRMRFMQKGFKKITSRWRSLNGLLSRYRRHKCTRLWKRRLSQLKKSPKKRNTSERCKKRRCKPMEKSSGRILNPRSPRYSADSSCSVSHKPGRRRSGCVRSGSRGTGTTWSNRGGPGSSPQGIKMRVWRGLLHPKQINRRL